MKIISNSIIYKIFKNTAFALVLPIMLMNFAFADEAARENLARLKDKDATVVSEALVEASNYQYYEIFNSVLKILMEQVDRHNNINNKTNPHILSKGFGALAKLSGVEQSDGISNLIDKIKDTTMIPSGNRHVDEAFQALENDYRFTQVQLKSLFGESLKSELGKLGEIGDLIIEGSVELIRDKTSEMKEKNKFIPIEGRAPEAKMTLETLAELTTSIALLTGPAGAGKSSIAKLIDELMANDSIPKTEAMKPFHGGFVIETTPARISSLAKSNDDNAQAAALEMYLDAIIEAQKILGIKIFVFIDEVHTMSGSQVEAIKRYTGGQSEIKFIFASTSEEFNIKFKQNEAFLRRVGQIPVEELPFEEIKKILYKTWIPVIERMFSVEFDEKVVDRVINESTKLLPFGGKIDGSIKLLNKLAVRSSPEEGGAPVLITKKELSELVREYYSLPIDPNNYAQTLLFFEELETYMNNIVFDQERMVKDVLFVYKNLLQSKDDNVKTVYVVGPTGVGKTYFGAQLALKVLNNSKALYEMNGNDLMEGGISLNSEFGAPNGVVSSDKTPGEFMAWLDDQAKGGKGGILLLNEIDKAHPDVLKKIMELMDRGFIVGGDGKKRYAKNLLIMMTSNRSVDMIFPNGAKTLTMTELNKLADSLDSDALKEMIDYSTSGNEDGKILPEIKNRIDLFTIALPFLKETAIKVAQGIINRSVEYFKIEHEVDISVEASLIEMIVNTSFNPLFGARPTIRAAKSTFQDLVNKAAREGKISEGEKIIFRHDLEFNMLQVLDINGSLISQLPAPKIKPIDPLDDEELVETLLSLEDSLNNKIFGQEELIAQLALTIASHLGSPIEKDKALSVFLIGATGTGKTETGKALAEILFKIKERTGKIDLGGIRFEGDFNNVFNPPKGYVNAQDAGEFEKYLIANPQGGVLLFDEASNMGSGNMAQKSELFKLLYQITDEPQWTSSASGRTYDLTKHIFIFNGNDGDKLFQGVGSDDLRKSIWEQNKDKSKTIALLRESGLPEPFLGRMSDIFLMSPLTRGIVAEKIVPKFLSKTVKALNEIQMTYSFSETFEAQLGEIFFTQDGGGRSVKNVIVGKLEGAITNIRLNLIRDGINFDNVKLELSLEDNQSGLVYIDKNNQERKVNLRIKALDLSGKTVLERTYDLTSDSDKTHLMSKENAILTAYHEAGHAVANIPEYTNQELAFITIRGRGSYLGYARYTEVVGQSTLSEINGIYQLAKTLAGSAGQQLAGFHADVGMRGDIRNAKSLINQLITSGVYPELIHEIQLNQNNEVVRMSDAAKLKSDELLKKGWDLALDLLIENWSAVEAIKTELMENGEVAGSKAQKLISKKPGDIKPSQRNIEKTKHFISKVGVLKVTSTNAETTGYSAQALSCNVFLN